MGHPLSETCHAPRWQKFELEKESCSTMSERGMLMRESTVLPKVVSRFL